MYFLWCSIKRKNSTFSPLFQIFLRPSKYIEFVNRDENVDYDTKMKELQTKLSEILQKEAESRAAVLEVFKDLGYTINDNLFKISVLKNKMRKTFAFLSFSL